MGWYVLLGVLICMCIFTFFQLRYEGARRKKEIQQTFKELESCISVQLLDFAISSSEYKTCDITSRAKIILDTVSPYGRMLSEYRNTWWRE